MDRRMRRLIAFRCRGATLVGTLDEAPGRTGLLIVSGGNEPRMGAHRGMARLAQRLAASGHPVFRFDRRGIGDSDGENHGFESSCPDIASAAAAFRKAAKLERLVAFGNCDAATALALFHDQAGVDALVLANPWVIERSADDLPPAAAIRARYAARLRNPGEWVRLLRGGVDLGKLAKGLVAARRKTGPAPTSLAGRLADALGRTEAPVTILLANGDNTAIAFADAFAARLFDAARTKVRIERLESASHSFATSEDKSWLFEQLQTSLRR
jgi:exosortase A-associated hydrolase 1